MELQLAAAIVIASAIVVASASVIAAPIVSAAAEQENQNDNPPAASAKTIVTHEHCLLKFKITPYYGAGKDSVIKKFTT